MICTLHCTSNSVSLSVVLGFSWLAFRRKWQRPGSARRNGARSPRSRHLSSGSVYPNIRSYSIESSGVFVNSPGCNAAARQAGSARKHCTASKLLAKGNPKFQSNVFNLVQTG
eukprot:2444315-Amphidinium_carterae.1